MKKSWQVPKDWMESFFGHYPTLKRIWDQYYKDAKILGYFVSPCSVLSEYMYECKDELERETIRREIEMIFVSPEQDVLSLITAAEFILFGRTEGWQTWLSRRIDLDLALESFLTKNAPERMQELPILALHLSSQSLDTAIEKHTKHATRLLNPSSEVRLHEYLLRYFMVLSAGFVLKPDRYSAIMETVVQSYLQSRQRRILLNRLYFKAFRHFTANIACRYRIDNHPERFLDEIYQWLPSPKVYPVNQRMKLSLRICSSSMGLRRHLLDEFFNKIFALDGSLT